MTHIAAIVLGFVEGATEFIPISSSGHLIIARFLLGLKTQSGDLAFDAILQLAASCALLHYFWRDAWHLVKSFVHMCRGFKVEQKDKVMVWAIIFGTIPAVVFGLLLQKEMDSVFRNVKLVALTLLLGSALFWI